MQTSCYRSCRRSDEQPAVDADDGSSITTPRLGGAGLLGRCCTIAARLSPAKKSLDPGRMPLL